MLPKLTGAPPAFALTSKPVPGVMKTTPRGELALKKLSGSELGAEKESGTPSQLISRRTPPNEPFAPATVPPPRSVLKASRAVVVPPPAPLSTTCAPAGRETVAKARAAVIKYEPRIQPPLALRQPSRVLLN